MIGFLTARAPVTFFGKTEDKEDIALIEFNDTSFQLKKTDFILRLITASKVFAINVIPTATEKQKDACEQYEGAFINKFEKAGFVKEECQTIDCPCIKGAEVIECELLKTEEMENSTKIAGKILISRRS